ncbi:MAG: NAD-dependent epimerase/dehydratase family protein [Bacteroidota bacterium]
MKVAVTGANGFVGSHLVDLLIAEGHSVKAIIRSSSNTRWLDGKPIELVRCGLTDVPALQEAFVDVEIVFHIAGVVTAKTEAGFMKGNVETTKNVLEACLNAPKLKKVLVTSSLAAAGPTKVGRPLKESDTPSPINWYGFSKKAQEDLATTYADRLPIVIVRPPAVYGERDTELYIFFNTINKGLFTKVGFNKKSLSMVHVRDLVRGMYLAATKENSTGETYFLSSDPAEYGWDEIKATSSRLLNKKPIPLSIPHGVVHLVGAVATLVTPLLKKTPTINKQKAIEIVQESWSCTSEKAKAELGYEPALSLEQGFKETFDWYRKEGWF